LTTARDPDADLVSLLGGSQEEVRHGARLLFRRHRAELLRFVAARGGGPEAEDIVQRALISAVVKIGQFSAEGCFRAWLWAIARNETLQALRARAMRPEDADAPFDPALFGLADALWHDETRLEAARVLCIRRGIEAFAAAFPRHAEAILLVACLKWHQRDLAQYLARSYDATRVFLTEARRKLRPFIAPCLDDPEDPPPDDDVHALETTEEWVRRVTGLPPDPPPERGLRTADALRQMVDALYTPSAATSGRDDLDEARHLLAFEAALEPALRSRRGRGAHRSRMALAAAIIVMSVSGLVLVSRDGLFGPGREKPFVLVEASPGFETGSPVRSALLPERFRVPDPEIAARGLAARMKQTNRPFRLETDGRVWQLDIMAAGLPPDLLAELERFGLRAEVDRPILRLRFERAGG
jgi:RNA polymerase sigma factor (sigma-70 family)